MITEASFALKNRILIGDPESPLFSFGNNDIIVSTPSGTSSVDAIGNELSVDTFTFSVRVPPEEQALGTNDGRYYMLRNNAYYILRSWHERFSEIEYATPVWWYVYDDNMEEQYWTNGYLKTVERQQDNTWKFTCMSAIGLLDSKIHRGGMYNHTFAAVAAEIIGDTFGYDIDPAIQSILVPGWLPYKTARENLHSLLFSVGASIVRSSEWRGEGRYEIQFLKADLHQIDADKLSIDNSIHRELPATRVEVMEHSFAALETDETVVLYDNTVAATGASNVTIVFDDPMHDLLWNDEPFDGEHNCNYAVVSGFGVLTGKRFTHISREIVIDETDVNAKPRTVRVENNCLVNPLNSYNVAQRLMAYYGHCYRFKGRAILQLENKAGQNFDLTPPFFNGENAFLEKMSYNLSSVVGADCDFLAGYVPSYVGNLYTHVEVMDSSEDTFEFAPSGENERIRLVVIGSGSGGSGGYYGQRGCGGVQGLPSVFGFDSTSGQDGVLTYDVSPEGYGGFTYLTQGVRPGGDPGTPGKAGKVFIVDLVISGPTSITVSIPEGGNGGDGGVAAHKTGTKWSAVKSPKSGKSGSETTCTVSTVVNGRLRTTTYSSANGAVSSSGYFDPINEVAYAKPGESGVPGGAGGLTDINPYIDTSGRKPYIVGPAGWSGWAGGKGEDVGANIGGTGGEGVIKHTIYDITVYGQTQSYSASGGGAGGAAFGANGGNGGAASWEQTPGYMGLLRGGKGGDGATPIAPAVPTPGSGGGAGHGGGSGGSAGGLFDYDFYHRYVEIGNLDHVGDYGEGGDGGTGGKGGPGVVLVYHDMEE